MMRFLLVLPVLLVAIAAHALSTRVPTQWPTLQMALDSCAACDTLWVEPGRYRERLVIPNRNLAILSRYAADPDSQWILSTILDGENQGTVLDVSGGLGNRLLVKGFTLTGGHASRNGSGYPWQWSGGAVTLRPESHLVLEDILFKENNGEFNAGGACLLSVTNGQQGEAQRLPRRLELRRVHLVNNLNFGRMYNYCLNGGGCETLVEQLVCEGNQDSLNWLVSLGARDSLVLRDIRILGVTNTYLDQSGSGYPVFMAGGEISVMVEQVRVRDCVQRGSPILDLYAKDTLTVRDFLIENNSFESMESPRPGVYFLSFGKTQAEDIIFRQNRARASLVFSTEAASDLIHADYAVPGYLRRFVYEDNVVGDTLRPNAEFGGGWRHLNVMGVSVSQFRVARNLSMWRGVLNDNGEGSWYPFRFDPVVNFDMRSEHVIEDGLFEDNLMLDGDDYDAILALPGEDVWPAPNMGRVFACQMMDNADTILRRLVFRNNRQPNHAPEWMSSWMYPEVGCTAWVGLGSTMPTLPGDLLIEDCLLEDNDDGALKMGQSNQYRNATVRNVVVKDCNRLGLFLGGLETTRVSNVLVDGVRQQDAWPNPNFSQQTALSPHAGIYGGSTDNVTIVNCDVPNLVRGSGLLDIFPPMQFRNLLCANNQYTYLYPPIWQPYPEFSYSCLEEPHVGVGNFVAPPGFDPGAEIPYLLAADSPCVDAGDPDPTWRDPEDPANPGWAAWPARGTVRADVGWLGGPGVASVLDWVDVSPRPEIPAARPERVTLGAPWPNPFNPRTTIPLTVNKHSLVKLAIHNLLGQEVAVLQNGVLPAGRYSFPWEAGPLASGVYIVTATINHSETTSCTVTLLR